MSTDSVLITGVVDARQERDVMTIDIPNAFVQTDIPDGEEKIIMKIRGVPVDILCDIAPKVYQDYVEQEGKHRALYVQMLKALYAMLVASLLFPQEVPQGYRVNWIRSQPLRCMRCKPHCRWQTTHDCLARGRCEVEPCRRKGQR